MALDAVQLVESVRADLTPVREQLLSHPYLKALEGGRISRQDLRPFAGEQHAIISSDLRSVAQLAAREGSEFFLEVLDGERAALAALGPFAAALGLGPGDLEAYEPMPLAHAYAAYMAWLASHASPAAVALAYLVNFPAWGENCARMSRLLKERLGFTEEQVGFFELFAQPLGAFEGRALAVVRAGLEHGDEPRHLRRAARLLQAYELLYWDALAAALH